LLDWFDRHRRDLPWRRDRDPYRVWLSEVMLQQTRVEAAIPYFERFLARFPAVGDLARAPVDEVLALWSGLGYYRRARQLHAAACRIAAAGEFPCTVEGWLALPGVGAYTAAAVASIAFGALTPVLDGNVERVMARRLALAADPKRGAARARLLAAAAELLDPARPGDSNQALMELGATLCLPRRAACAECPLLGGCRAAAAGEPERYPPPRRKRATERRRLLVAVVARGGRVLLYRRPAESELLPGSWELPWVALEDAADAASAATAEEPVVAGGAAAAGGDEAGRRLGAKYGGGRWRVGPAVGRVRHGITFRDLEVTVCRAEVGLGDAGEVREVQKEEVEAGIEPGWFDAAERARLPMSSLVGKVLRAAARAGDAGGAGGGG
jgi:A/G-specific adenine glycosylase